MSKKPKSVARVYGALVVGPSLFALASMIAPLSARAGVASSSSSSVIVDRASASRSLDWGILGRRETWRARRSGSRACSVRLRRLERRARSARDARSTDLQLFVQISRELEEMMALVPASKRPRLLRRLSVAQVFGAWGELAAVSSQMVSLLCRAGLR